MFMRARKNGQAHSQGKYVNTN